MRTTLAIDDDVLNTAKAIARQRGVSLGEVVSDLARQALRKPTPGDVRSGIALLPGREGAGPVTLEIVNRLRDEAP